MAAQIEVRSPTSGCATDREWLAATLVAALELALLAAQRLLGGPDTPAGRHADLTACLERVLALAEPGVAPDERTLKSLTRAEPSAATGEPAAQGGPNDGHLGFGPLDAERPHDRADIVEAPATPACSAGLTCRELEVLRLVAAGNSNRQVAAALYLSPRTVERHVANVYLKIGAHSKAEATAYALRHGLALSSPRLLTRRNYIPATPRTT
jgi:DNA-binding CsgD family transcriptional regulator